MKKAVRKLKAVFSKFFKKERKRVASQVVKAFEEVTKADVDPAMIQKVLDQIELEGWAVLVGDVQGVLEQICKDGALKAMIQIGIGEEGITETVNQLTLNYAVDRAAEMVGKRWVDGELIDNPNAYWRIDETTREFLRTDVAQAIEGGWATDRLAAAIEENYGFSEDRAQMIARTECAIASNEGSLISYKQSGVVQGKEWILSSGHPADDECDMNAEAGVIPLDEDFPSGDACPPLHPNCLCSVVPVVYEEEEG